MCTLTYYRAVLSYVELQTKCFMDLDNRGGR